MRKNTRDTIRRPKDYERDPAWDAEERERLGEKKHKAKVHTTTEPEERFEVLEDDDR
ncbi:MAG: hypothetical protein AB7C91_07160 [Sphaerochaeta sp.]|jgi:hypothetical protein|uniref:hypothetical protein n=1 Tax=Sphaerochaeta sp. TaxID=1972642 RepID=UPI002FCB4390